MKTNLKSTETIGLVNPWSKAISQFMTWKQITDWCNQNVHPADRAEWLKAARQYAKNNNGDELWNMIIGS